MAGDKKRVEVVAIDIVAELGSENPLWAHVVEDKWSDLDCEVREAFVSQYWSLMTVRPLPTRNSTSRPGRCFSLRRRTISSANRAHWPCRL